MILPSVNFDPFTFAAVMALIVWLNRRIASLESKELYREGRESKGLKRPGPREELIEE